MDEVGDWFGDFSHGADTEQKFWLGARLRLHDRDHGDRARWCRPTSCATGRCCSCWRRARPRRRSTTGAFFFFDDDVFIYLLNFLVDGSLVLDRALCAGRCAGRGGRRPHRGVAAARLKSLARRSADPRAFAEALLPPGGALPAAEGDAVGR